jgi:hypothetical protein
MNPSGVHRKAMTKPAIAMPFVFGVGGDGDADGI